MEITADTALIATWLAGREFGVDPPNTLLWSDGRAGTLEELAFHEPATHSLCEDSGQTVLQIYPGIVAEAKFDFSLGCWQVSDIGAEPLTLHLRNPQAADEDILWQMGAGVVQYRLRVIR